MPTPPPEVCISMLGLIHTMEPLSVIMVSPSSSWQTTTPIGSPLISYCMMKASLFLFFKMFFS